MLGWAYRVWSPEGFVSGALLFTLYLLLFGQIINIFKITYHLFVDDIQLLFSVILSEAVRLSTRDRPINGMADKYIK